MSEEKDAIMQIDMPNAKDLVGERDKELLKGYTQDWSAKKKEDMKILNERHSGMDATTCELGYDFVLKNPEWIRKQMQREKEGKEMEQLHDPELLKDFRDKKGIFKDDKEYEYEGAEFKIKE